MLIHDKIKQLNWKKNNGLIPAIIQNIDSGEVLMLGHMNKESIIKTEQIGYITFFSQSKQRLWTKGEYSGNTLKLIRWFPDCDKDAILILVLPDGPTCHKNTNSCFHPAICKLSFLHHLERIISKKKSLSSLSNDQSYTSHLFNSGIKRIAQKVGEEGLETALAAISCQSNVNELIHEASDLIYHLLVLLQQKSLNFNKIIKELHNRHNLKK